jgi:thiamine-phosphate pyrophosphorylase
MKSPMMPEAHAVRADQRIRGLYALTPEITNTARLVERTAEALAGGTSLVQYRNKHGAAALRRDQALALKRLCHSHQVPLLINDDVELAREIGADGVHLGRDDAPIDAARAVLGAQALVGVSCYNELSRALNAQRAGADYVAFGSLFVSAVKPDAVRASTALLREARARVALAIVGIGGITPSNAPEVVAAGADAVAVISALFDAPDVSAAAQAFCRAFSSFS